VVVGVRPEALELCPEGLPAEVQAVDQVGADAYVFCSAQLGADGAARLVARVETRRAPARGERVCLRPSDEFPPHLFDADSGERLGP
jgi:multiple sugar transport system ATP-binding protein